MNLGDLQGALLILLPTVVVLATALQIVASLRWAPKASGIVCIAATLLIGVTTFALFMAYASNNGGARIDALLLISLIPAGCWAAGAVVIHLALSALRSRLTRDRES